MEPLPIFSLFEDPLRESVFEPSDAVCDCCGRVRGMIYTGPQCGDQDEELQCCPWCIAEGKTGLRFNDSTIYPAFETSPQLDMSDRDLVEHRTPGFWTWQDNGWRMCCGRACVYIGEADAEDLKGRWASAVPSIFADAEMSAEEIREMVGTIKRGGSPCAYAFRCQLCGGLTGLWDCD